MAGVTPMLQGRPLRDNRLDMGEYYVSRPEVEGEIARSLRRGLNVLLVGERGSGRTTLLHRLQWDERQRGPQPREMVLVRAGRAATASQLLYLVWLALAGDVELPGSSRMVEAQTTHADANDDRRLPPTWEELASTTAALTRLTELSARLVVPPILLVDDLNPHVGNQVFGLLRDEVWSLGFQWVVSSTPSEVPVLTRPPADAFFDSTVSLPSELTDEQARDLLRRRLGRAPEVELPAGPWLPRDLINLAAQTDPSAWASTQEARARRQAEISVLGRPASMLAAVMQGLGPVSPSDPRLLDELGWTASRASQVLRNLYEEGFVTYTEHPTGRPGRPARIYRLVNPLSVRRELG